MNRATIGAGLGCWDSPVWPDFDVRKANQFNDSNLVVLRSAPFKITVGRLRRAGGYSPARFYFYFVVFRDVDHPAARSVSAASRRE
jgi:hypothetical protein